MRAALGRAGKPRNPLEPLASINWLVLCALVLGAMVSTIGALLGKLSLFGWGHGADICATSSAGLDGGADWSQMLQPRAGVTMGAGSVKVCTATPTFGQRWWYSLEAIPGTITLLTVVLLTYLALRQAERFGLYSPGIATRLRVLGWFLVVESLLGPAIKVYASRTLWITMTPGMSQIQWNPSYVALFAGLALLSLARIMRVGTAMREDLEGVV